MHKQTTNKNDGDHQKMSKQKKTQKQIGHKKLLSPKSRVTTSTPAPQYPF